MDQVGSTIELPGSTYLYELAFLAIAFVGFSSIVAVLRQTGSQLSKIQILLTRSYIEHGLLIAGLSILPMLLNLFGLPYVLMWPTLELAGCAYRKSNSRILWCRPPRTGWHLRRPTD
jgi:hypothetical protein